MSQVFVDNGTPQSYKEAMRPSRNFPRQYKTWWKPGHQHTPHVQSKQIPMDHPTGHQSSPSSLMANSVRPVLVFGLATLSQNTQTENASWSGQPLNVGCCLWGCFAEVTGSFFRRSKMGMCGECRVVEPQAPPRDKLLNSPCFWRPSEPPATSTLNTSNGNLL